MLMVSEVLHLIWFESYLINRNQSVRIGDVESGKLNKTCGFPPGIHTRSLSLSVVYKRFT